MYETYSPSVQDAVLSSLLSIAKHAEGAIWLIKQNLIDFVLSSFSCTSFYVRKRAVNFFNTSVPLWTSSKFSSIPQKEVLNKSTRNIMNQIISGIQITDMQEMTVSECCIMVLKEFLNFPYLRVLLCNDFDLIQRLCDDISQSLEESEMCEKIADILLVVFSSDPSIEPAIKEVIRLLANHQLFVPSIHLTSSLLRLSEKYKPLTKEHLCFILMPLHILSSSRSAIPAEDLLPIFNSTLYFSILNLMKVKSNCILFLNSCLTALSELSCFMDPQALESVISAIHILTKKRVENASELHPWLHACLENRTILLSLLQLFKSFFPIPVFSKMNITTQLLIFEYLLNFLETPSNDSNFLSEVINHLKCIVNLNNDYPFHMADDLIERFAQVLCRKLLDKKEPVVDNSIHLVNEMISGKGSQQWTEILRKFEILSIIWDIAIEGNHDGPIKASALHVIIEACLQIQFWEDIKSLKKVTEINIVKILYNYAYDPDFFVQRESVVCLFHWMRSKWDDMPLICKERLFCIFTFSVKSLDLELKLIALDSWKSLMDCNMYFPLVSSPEDVLNYIKCLCQSGFGSSLLFAIHDYDPSVQYKAATIMHELRKKLLGLGLTQDFISFEEENVILPNENPSGIMLKFSEEEKIAGIDNVMNSTTAQLITSISRPPDYDKISDCKFSNSSAELKTISCPINSFWIHLWSVKIDSLLFNDDKSLENFSDCSISLLEDIIAAKETDIKNSMNDTPDCY
ncbi:uncharacterized protein LOC118187858 isoform X2 [Stegodyphus dumicola]|nr:uncharacterized protein LOC118187858 isoform X2 [Stegodyphus dumicola]